MKDIKDIIYTLRQPKRMKKMKWHKLISPMCWCTQAVKLTPIRQLETKKKWNNKANMLMCASQEAHSPKAAEGRRKIQNNAFNTLTCASHEAYPPKAARNEDKEEITRPTCVHMQAERLTPLRRLGVKEKNKQQTQHIHVQAIRLTPRRWPGMKNNDKQWTQHVYMRKP